MQINRVSFAPASFRGATFDRTGTHIKEMCLGDKTSGLIDDTVERLDAISDEFKRDVTVKLSTPSDAINAHTIEVFDNKNDNLLGIKVLFCERNDAENAELNKKQLKAFEGEIRETMTYRYSNGQDRYGKPILNTMA